MTVILMYALVPGLSSLFSSLFFCMELDDGEQWLQRDLQVKCWGGMHLKYSYGLGLPALAAWIIIMPAIGLFMIFRNRKNLDDRQIILQYRMIYHGFKEEYFFWEYFNLLRKLFLILSNIFLNLFVYYFKALLCLLTLTIFMRLHHQIKPYRDPKFNILEQRE